MTACYITLENLPLISPKMDPKDAIISCWIASKTYMALQDCLPLVSLNLFQFLLELSLTLETKELETLKRNIGLEIGRSTTYQAPKIREDNSLYNLEWERPSSINRTFISSLTFFNGNLLFYKECVRLKEVCENQYSKKYS